MKNRGRTITIRVKDRPNIGNILDEKCIGSAGPYPSIRGMRKLYWGENVLIVKYGAYIYNFGEDSGQELPF